MLAIVLVDYNGVDDTRRCLESLAGQQAAVFVVDNASKTNVAEVLAGCFPTVRFLRSEVNGGWAGGNNLGLQAAMAAGASLIVLLNNDTVVEPQFAERLRRAAEAHPQFGILGPVIRDLEPPHAIQTDGVRFNRPDQPGFFQRLPVPLETSDPPRVIEVDIVNGCCLMLRREVAERIGLIDEQFFLIHEEADFCLRAQAAGYRLGVIAEALVLHKHSSTFQREGQGLQRYYDARNLLRLLRRHHGRPGERSYLASMVHAVRYALSRYALERETGHREAARAVLAGLYDGFTGRYGPRRDGWRPGFNLLQLLIGGAWRVKRSLSKVLRLKATGSET